MLIKDPLKRISIKGIKEHEFFSDMDFEKLFAMEITPPFIPDIKNKDDCIYVESDLLGENPKDSVNAGLSLMELKSLSIK